LEDINKKLLALQELTTQVNETEFINRKHSKEIEEIIMFAKTIENNNKNNFEQLRSQFSSLQEVSNSNEKVSQDKISLLLMKSNEKNIYYENLINSLQELNNSKINEVIVHQNNLIQDFTEKFNNVNELNLKQKESFNSLNEKFIDILSKNEISDISWKKTLDLLKLEILSIQDEKLKDSFTEISVNSKSILECKDEISLLNNKIVLYSENYSELMSKVSLDNRKYDSELNKLAITINNEKELLTHKIEKCVYSIEEQNKFANIALSNQEKDITKKMTANSEASHQSLQSLQKEFADYQTTNQNNLNLLLMKYQSDLTNTKDSIISVIKDKVASDLQETNERFSKQHEETLQNFNSIAENIFTFSQTLDHLHNENKELMTVINKNKDILHLEIFSLKDRYSKEIDSIHKMMKESLNEIKYEENSLLHRLQIVENSARNNNFGMGSKGSQPSAPLPASSLENSLLMEDDQPQQQILFSSQQNSFLFDPNNPGGGGGLEDDNQPFYLSRGQQQQPPISQQGQEQIIKLSSALEMTVSRLSNLENDFYNLQIELQSLKSLQSQFQILQVSNTIFFLFPFPNDKILFFLFSTGSNDEYRKYAKGIHRNYETNRFPKQ
jgi:hypothetical protein